MGILAEPTTEERLVQALKFVKVATTHNGKPSNIQQSGFLTDVSVAMLIVEMKRRGLEVSHPNGRDTDATT